MTAGETRRVVVRGRVQGVGYREFCVAEAHRLGVRGWVRNRRDGTVEAMLQGDPARLHAMCERLREGPPVARVDALDVTAAPEEGRTFDRFERLPTA
jgi:acylphosphatase